MTLSDSDDVNKGSRSESFDVIDCQTSDADQKAIDLECLNYGF